jgi:hypothetical protein
MPSFRAVRNRGGTGTRPFFIYFIIVFAVKHVLRIYPILPPFTTFHHFNTQDPLFVKRFPHYFYIIF